MSRSPRLVLPEQPLHITKRGNNRSQIFTDRSDFTHFLELLEEASHFAHCRIHAYVLMTNHFHVVASPSTEFGAAKFMQLIGRNYCVHFNRRFGRTGTMWDGRYYSALIDSPRYFFQCCRYIELNPVRALMVAHPAEYEWSSFHHNAMGFLTPLVQPHPLYQTLGNSDVERRMAYQALYRVHLDVDVCDAIRRATHKGETLGQRDEPDAAP